MFYDVFYETSCVEELNLIANQIRRWSAPALDAMPAEERAAESSHMQATVARLDFWSRQLVGASGNRASGF